MILMIVFNAIQQDSLNLILKIFPNVYVEIIEALIKGITLSVCVIKITLEMICHKYVFFVILQDIQIKDLKK